jgi:glycosyltransferase involved in cell wall biosynthesis
MAEADRIPILYLAPWVDLGGTDKGTIDWFQWLDRDRYQLSLITTQPSPNRRLAEVIPYAKEVWPLPEMMAGDQFPLFILNFIASRGIQLVHVMNSRLGFDLLPDLRALPTPPSVVVQLHVEESDRSGYVRYVTTRYGNLVDAFSVTSQQLADAIVRDYDVPRGKCNVIYTGVDAASEFSPKRVTPISGLEDGPLHILYPGRLVKQKDPLLMVRVAAALKESGLNFRIHSVGDGEMMEQVRLAVDNAGLDDVVMLHGPQRNVPRWFASCQLLLLTSEFEGIPYVVFEAMAMRLPTVAPALPGVVEALGGDSSLLITPRDDVQRYKEVIMALAGDEPRRTELGSQARSHALQRYSLAEMADAHDELYGKLLARRPDSFTGSPAKAARSSVPLLFHARPSKGTPLVSVIVPCFNHGRYLTHCLESINGQTYPAIETIIVDDGSTDQETVEQLETLEQASSLTVVRLSSNKGPSGARNAGIARAKGRYILPLDADNLLLPDAVQTLVAQLQTAGERVGFIYPNLQFFGNRTDYFEAPDYDLYTLLNWNYCDTCSLIDREIFDAGFNYAEEIVLGHEDWDFVLQLASRGVYGEPARGKTLLFRKIGFTRSDTVEYARNAFHFTVRRRHPDLYDHEEEIKGEWSPALSIIGLDVVPSNGEEAAALVARFREQSSGDVEALVRADGDIPSQGPGPRVRRVPAALTSSSSETLAECVDAARGPYVLATRDTGFFLLEDRAVVEKVLRTFSEKPDLAAIAFTDAGSIGRFPYRLLHSEEVVELHPHAVAWSRRAAADMKLAAASDPIAAIVRMLSHADETMQWRHLPRSSVVGEHETGGNVREIVLSGRQRAKQREAAPLAIRTGYTPRLSSEFTWTPPQTRRLARYRESAGEKRYVAVADEEPRDGYLLEYYLGLINRFPVPGTAELEAVDEEDGQTYRVLEAHANPEDHPSRRTVGYVETVPLPLLDPLVLGIHPEAGYTLVCGADDPLAGSIDSPATIGWLESYPINPRRPPHARILFDLEILTRVLDRVGRRHVYGVGGLQPEGEYAGELGYLHKTPEKGSIPVWLSSGGVLHADPYVPVAGRPSVRTAVRWTLAPLGWSVISAFAPRLRASIRRAATSLVCLLKSPSKADPPSGEPIGYLRPERGRSGIPLYAARHPVTGDQLLTCWRLEADDMGYVDAVLLGYTSAGELPMGRPRVKRLSVPWASRFGMTALRD